MIDNSFALDCRDGSGDRPVLAGVQAAGRLEGVLFELTLRQTYRNASKRLLEVVYTFPLPQQAVLLGFASELNGERKVGSIVAKREAERQYEAALAEGDAPVMLEALDDGLHTANIGNLKPGEEVVLEVRFAQLLAFEQGRLRVAIPTTIAPRYGNAELAGLQAQQVPQTSLLADYPLSLSVAVTGTLARGTVECPTHRLTCQAVDGVLKLDLATGARMDRDVVITLQPAEPRTSLVIRAEDALAATSPIVLMAALQPPVTAPRPSVMLKLLVDCSGSMGGDSIGSARAALKGALDGLSGGDHVSVSRFGSTVRHVAELTACTPQALEHLKHVVDGIDADLGGTEMAAALKAVFKLRVPSKCDGADVLLVTDGEIWQAEEMIAAARASGHRVFAIGVGTSPAEGVLRSLAEATGGACEFATPGEALEAAAARMLARIRQQPWRDVQIDWGCVPLWQTTLPASVFGGDTLMVFAGMAAPVEAVRLLATDVHGAHVEIARGSVDANLEGDTLPRMAAARRIAVADEGQARDLAITYQLLGKHTNCILVHQRSEDDKAAEEAELHRVSSMLAAGWGATATVMQSPQASYAMPSMPSVWRSARSHAAAAVDALASSWNDMDDDIDFSAFVRTHVDEKQPVSLRAMADAVFEHLSRGGSVQGLASHCQALALHADAQLALDEAVGLGLSLGEAWLMLGHWVNRRPAEVADTAVTTALRPHLDGVDATAFANCMQLFDRTLGAYDSESWTLSRSRRLRQAMSKAVSG